MSKIFSATWLLLILIASQGLVQAQARPASQRRQADSSQKPSEALANANGPSSSLASETNVTNREIAPTIELVRGDAKNYYRLAVKYASIGMFDEAIAALRFAIKLKPAYIEAYYALGEIYSDLHRWTEATAAYERVLQLDPKDDEAHLRLEDAYAKLRAERRSVPLTEESDTQNNTSQGHKVALNRSTPKATSQTNVSSSRSSVSAAPQRSGPVVTSTSSRESSKPNDILRPRSAMPRPTGTTTKNPANPQVSSGQGPKSISNGPPKSERESAAKNSPTIGPTVTSKPDALSKNANDVAEPLGPSTRQEKLSESTVRVSSAIVDHVRSMSNPDGAGKAVSVKSEVDEGAPVTSTASKTSAQSSNAVSVALTRTYRVGIGDVLDVHVSDFPANQSTLFSVTASGLLEYPVLDRPLQVVGLTIEEISDRLRSDLKRLALAETAQVLVGVREYSSHAILVSGLVKEPGTKILRREAIPLYVVLADAQPVPEAASATVISHDTSKPVTVDIADSQATEMLVQPGDVIIVQPNSKQFFYIAGEIKSPGEKLLRPGITLTQAILASGGLVRKARQIQLARAGENGLLAVSAYRLEDITSGKIPDPVIKPGDRIMIEH
jgi:protein involved in polysaccharide export with SLBB domain